MSALADKKEQEMFKRKYQASSRHQLHNRHMAVYRALDCLACDMARTRSLCQRRRLPTKRHYRYYRKVCCCFNFLLLISVCASLFLALCQTLALLVFLLTFCAHFSLLLLLFVSYTYVLRTSMYTNICIFCDSLGSRFYFAF